SYIHTGSKLGVMIEVNSETDFVARTDEFQDFTRDLAMHIAASAPIAVSREDLDQAVLERERKIYREQALEEGKPENVVDRIVDGKIEKYYQEVCLMEQPYVKDPDRTVKDLHNELVAKCGENVTIRRFVRFVLGEES
ncbi:MAG TPA: translation elongation factor Ts, partial [Candidatus Latescibacteria bacterium]|nr:translation elongation factor Ts [Candidatus Latescibacterota bacterium]